MAKPKAKPAIKSDEQLVEENKSLKKQIEDLRNELDRVNEVNRQLQLLLADAPVKEAPVPTGAEQMKLTFQHGDSVYGFNFTKAKLKGQQITADMVVADPQLQQVLISQKSGMLRQIK